MITPHRLVVLSLALTVSACLPLRPPVSQPPAAPQVRTVSVVTTPGASCALQVTALRWVDAVADAAGFIEWPGVPADLRDTHVTCTAPGFVALSLHQTLTTPHDERIEPPMNLVPLPLPPPVRPFAPVYGPLRIDGPHFYTESGRVWRWQGATMFLLLERQMRGENIHPQIDWMVAHGVNVARVFVAGVRWPGSTFLYDLPGWTDHLSRLASTLAAAGIRLEATVCTEDCSNVGRWQPVLQRVYDTLAGQPMVFVEWVNEPWVQGFGLITSASINRRGILSASGWQIEGDGLPVPMLDYGTVHLPRDLDHFPRNSKDLLEMQQTTGKPWVGDEPLGIADYDKDGSGARTTNALAVQGHFAIGALFAHTTIHSQFGLEGRAPSASEITSEALATRILRVWQAIPPDALLGRYARMGLDFPLEWAGGDSTLSTTHGYASILGDRAWAVVPMPRANWVPFAAPGWTLVASPLFGVVELTR